MRWIFQSAKLHRKSTWKWRGNSSKICLWRINVILVESTSIPRGVLIGSDQLWNIGKCWCKCKKRNVCEKNYVWNSATCSCENGKYLASVIDGSAITCDEIIESHDEEIKTIPTTFNENKATCKTKIFIPHFY